MRLAESLILTAVWWILLGLASFVVLPLALHMLHRAFRAAALIRRVTGEVRAAGERAAEQARGTARLDPAATNAVRLARRISRLEPAARGRGPAGGAGGEG